MPRPPKAGRLGLRLAQSASLCALLVAISLPAVARAGITKLNNLFVFGDSLSDNGNSGALTMGAFPPYPGNRFSNGKVAVEYLWELYNPGNTSFAPSLLGGSNFAIGGATTGSENNIAVGNSLPIFTDLGNAWELDSFQAAAPSFDPKTSLFAIWLYPNDIFYYLNTPGSSSGTFDGGPGTPIPLFDVPQHAVDNIVGTIEELAASGAQNFLVMNTPDLSKTPAFLTSPLASTIAQLSLAFNTKLSKEMDALSASQPLLDIRTFPTDQVLKRMIDNPSAFGFSNTTQPCFLNGVVCSDPSSYLFWDALHPTTRTHSLLAQSMANTVPGPLPALGGLAVFGWSRQLRRRLRRAA